MLGLKLQENRALSTLWVCVSLENPTEKCWRSGLGQVSSEWGLRKSSRLFVLCCSLLLLYTEEEVLSGSQSRELSVWALLVALLRRWSLPRSRAGLCQPRSPKHQELGAQFPT